MKHTYRALVAATFCAIVSQPVFSSPLEDCIASVTIEGSFMGGRTFKGNAFIPNSNQDEQLKKVAKTLVKEGLTISTLDKDLGIVTASYSKKPFGSSTPQTTTFSMIFEQNEEGVDASATLATPAGITTNEEQNKKDMCSLLIQQ